MKSPYVNELEPNQVITTSFLVHSKDIRQKKSGEFYLSLLLADRTGELDAKMWDNVADVHGRLRPRRFRQGEGPDSGLSQPAADDHPQVRRMDESEVDFADYFPSSKRDAGEMWARATRHRRRESEIRI